MSPAMYYHPFNIGYNIQIHKAVQNRDTNKVLDLIAYDKFRDEEKLKSDIISKTRRESINDMLAVIPEDLGVAVSEQPYDQKPADLMKKVIDTMQEKTIQDNNYIQGEIDRIQRLLATNSDIYEVKEDLYSLLEELGISFKKTRCKKCLWDYYNIIREELGIIPDASEESDFNQFYGMEFIYLKSRPVAWNGHIMDNNTDPAIIRAFLKTGASGYYRLNDNYDKNKNE